MSLKRYISTEFKHLRNTLNFFKKDYWLTVLYDIVLFILLSAAIFIYATQSYNLFVDFQSNNSLDIFGAGISDLNTDLIDQTSQNIEDLYGRFIFFSAFLVIFGLLIFSLMKGLIYAILLKKRFSLKFYLNFFLINLVWLIIWLLVFSFIFKFVRFELQLISNVLAVLVMLYLTGLLFASFAKGEKLLRAFNDTWKLIKMTHMFIFPYAVFSVLFFALQIILLVFIFLPSFYENMISSLFLICFLAWARIYIISIVKRLLKSKD